MNNETINMTFKKTFIQATLMVYLISLSSSCSFLSSNLLSIKNDKNDGLYSHKYYKERMKYFLVREDSKQIVHIGEKYNYIFNDDIGIIHKIVAWKSGAKIKADVSETALRVNKLNEITGHVTFITSPNDLSRKETTYLKSIGFTQEYDKSLSIKIRLKGTRYSSSKEIEQYASPIVTPSTSRIEVMYEDGDNRELSIEGLTSTPIVLSDNGKQLVSAVGKKMLFLLLAAL